MKNILQTIISIAFLTYLLTSCSKDNVKLERAMEFAGNNKVELKKVLDHYKEEKDSLKLKAAIYLIENMPNYYSYRDETYEPIKAALYYAYVDNDNIPKHIEAKGQFISLDNQEKIFDSRIITADYLIDNIDISYKHWKEKTWNKSLSFNDFCEYLLPYRLNNEPLENWKKPYLDKYGPVLDSLYTGTDVVEAASVISKFLAQNEKLFFNSDFFSLNPGAMFYYKYKGGSCIDLRDMSIYLLRSLGIPCAGHFYRISPDGSDAMHTWAVIKDTTGMDILFQTPGEVGRDIKMAFRKGKVYELRFSLDINKLPLQSDLNIPNFFLNPFISDISEKYTGCNRLTLNLFDTNNEYVFLGVHTDYRTTLIDFAKIINNQAVFNNIETELIYQFFYAEKNSLKPAYYPILFEENDKSHVFKPTNSNEDVKLYRKFPYPQWLYNYVNFMYNATIETSNEPSFSNLSFKYQIRDSIKNTITQIIHPTSREIRYLRFRSPSNRKIDIAEFNIFAKEDTLQPLTDISISGSPAADIYKNGKLENIMDNNVLTVYMSADTGAVVNFDLNKKHVLSRIEILPHTDDNFIRIGEVYELFYHFGEGGWISLGEKIAKQEYLEYNVPINALFWLKNKTQGKEEQVFYIKEGKQIFTGKTNEI